MMNIHQWKPACVGMGPWRHWLTDHGSLTRRLQARCRTFRVQRLSQSISQPFPDEFRPLKLRAHECALTRDVLLLCGDTPLIYAHTVIPLDGLRGPWQALGKLGNRSLGATLFATPEIERFPLEYRRLDKRDYLYHAAAAHMNAPLEYLWARRSLFALNHHPLQVTEVFLPAVLDLSIAIAS
jgi:chorismate--pyruvate lyase